MAKEKTLTKSRILSVGRTLFSVHGFNNTTLDDIITACGITKGAFYHYFKSKEMLCESVLDHAAIEYKEMVVSIDKSAEPIEQLRQLVTKIIHLNSSGEWVNCRLILRLSLEMHDEHPQIQRKLNDFRQWCMEVYADLIENCRAMDQLSKKTPTEVQAQMLFSSIMGLVTLGTIDPDIQIDPGMPEMIIKSLGSD